MLMMSEGSKSYWSWARSLTSVIGKTVSKQAIFSRMTDGWVATVKELLQEVLFEQANAKVKPHLFEHFKNVWIQDSTTLHLPDVLAERFKGNTSRGKQKSVAKLNVIIHAVNGLCAVMEWSSFTVNEQQLSKSILKIAQAGDLVIRDLGYFVLPVFRQLAEAKIYFLSRWKYATKLYHPESGCEIALADLLQGKAWIDQEVICGKETRVKVRLVAIKLSNEQANERRRKAKKDRDKRLNHSKAYYQLLGYVVFITTVESEKWNYRQVAEAYRLRWNIEILFKSWKSGFKMEHLIPEARTNTQRVESILYLLLIYIAWFQLLVYTPLRWGIYEKTGKYLSIIKVATLIKSKHMDWIKNEITDKLINEIAYYCCYDKRHDRMNEEMLLQRFFKPLA
jgi:hypothetical protein